MNTKIVRESKGFSETLTVFATEEYLKVRSNNYGWFVSDAMVLPFLIDKKLIFSRLIFSSSILYRDHNSVRDINDEKFFLDQVCSLAEKLLHVDFIAPPLASAIFSCYPDNGAIVAKYGTYLIGLDNELDDIKRKFNKTTRYEINKAIRDGCEVFQSVLDSTVIEIIKDTYNRSNDKLIAPKPEFLNNLQKYLLDNIRVYQVRLKDKIQGVAIVVYDKITAYYYFGGSINRPAVGSIPLLHWKLMQDLKKDGVKYYDFMGVTLGAPKDSKSYGLLNFKRKFGGDLYQGYIFKKVFSPTKYKLFYLLVRCIYRLNNSIFLGDVIDKYLLYNKVQNK